MNDLSNNYEIMDDWVSVGLEDKQESHLKADNKRKHVQSGIVE